MKQQTHVVDILSTAKRLADADGDTLLSYIIGMALIQASQAADRRFSNEADIRNIA